MTNVSIFHEFIFQDMMNLKQVGKIECDWEDLMVQTAQKELGNLLVAFDQTSKCMWFFIVEMLQLARSRGFAIQREIQKTYW